MKYLLMTAAWIGMAHAASAAAADVSGDWSIEGWIGQMPLQVSYAGQLESATSMKGDILVGGNPSGSFTAHKPGA
jgi:hypothetical protein